MKLIFLVAAVVMGCANDGPGSPSRSTRENPASLVGIWPADWTCDQIATTEVLAQLLGGPTRVIESAVRPVDGVPRPCNYLVEGPLGAEPWTFDLDCRDGYRQRADALFAQYTQTSSDLVGQYNEASDAAPGPTPKPPRHDPDEPPADAAPVRRAPEVAREVPIGTRGLDHHGQGLLFIDDDAPCYVRIVGPDADRRLALAKHVVTQLTIANAPMTPRAAP